MKNYITVFTCSKCGKSFERARTNVENKYKKTNLVFCSKECWYQHLKDEAKVENICPVCGKMTFELRMHVKNGPRCCSRECGWIKERRRKESECVVCGKRYEVHLSKKDPKCCSIECAKKYLARNKVEITCPNCGKKVQKTKAVVKRVEKSFCSHKCFFEYSKGENAPMWDGGKTSKNRLERGSKRFKEWRKAVFERDNYTCQECKTRGGYLHPHHIKSFSEYPTLRYDIDNGVTLCLECHGKKHGITYKIAS